MTKKTVRATIPVHKKDDFIRLARGIADKHDALGADSPLNKVNIDMTLYKQLLGKAEEMREKSKTARAQSESFMQQSNTCLGLEKRQNAQTPKTVYNLMTSIRDILLVVNTGSEEALSLWGFNVVISTSRVGRKKKQK